MPTTFTKGQQVTWVQGGWRYVGDVRETTTTLVWVEGNDGRTHYMRPSELEDNQERLAREDEAAWREEQDARDEAFQEDRWHDDPEVDYEDWASQYDDDPSPYSGDYSEE